MVAISVIIPAYNARMMLPLGLTALSLQRFPRSRFEVIVVDDASTDGTLKVVRDLRLPYDLKVLTQKVNAGAGAARNRGADAAEGELLLFCDADTIGSPSYLARHLEIHQAETSKSLLVSGAARWRPLYTVVYPRMSPGAVWTIRQLGQAHPWIGERLPDGWEATTEPIQLAHIKDVPAGRIKAFNPPTFWPGFMHQVVSEVGERLDDFPTAWMACMGSNFSVPKLAYRDVGGFETGFQGYGQEDWELGYRLQQAGVGVHCTERVANYHQESPSSPAQRQIANMRNYQYFAAKHSCPELDFFALCQVGGDWGPLRLGRLFSEYRQAQTRPELQPLTQLFADLADRYRSWVGVTCAAQPAISVIDCQRAWTEEQVRTHRQALRCLGSGLDYFAAALHDLASADTSSTPVVSSRNGPTVVHMVGWPGLDGVSTYVRDACHAIAKQGGRPLVVGEGGPALELLQGESAGYLRYGLDVDHLHSPKAQAEELAQALSVFRPDVVHCHKTDQLAVAVRLKDHFQCRLVITLHAMEFTAPEFEANWPNADALVFVSQAIADGFANRYGSPPMRWLVATPGVALDRLPPGRRDQAWLQQQGIPGQAPIVAYVGRVGLDKLHVPAQLIQATKALRDRYPDLRALIVGPGSDQLAELAASANQSLGAEFVYLFPPQHDVRPFYRAATVVVGSGRVAMEALAMGRPVVAYGAAGFVGLVQPETLQAAIASNFGDHSALCEHDSPGLFHELAVLVGDSHLRAGLVPFGRRSAERYFGLDSLKRGLDEAYSF